MKLGYVDVDAMLREISVHQLREWRAYSDLEPWDEVRADYRSAQIVTALVNINRSKGTSARPVSDFVMPFGDLNPPRPQMDWKQMKAIGHAAFIASEKARQRPTSGGRRERQRV